MRNKSYLTTTVLSCYISDSFFLRQVNVNRAWSLSLSYLESPVGSLKILLQLILFLILLKTLA